MDDVISELRQALMKCQQSMSAFRKDEATLAKLQAAGDKIQLSISLLEAHSAHVMAR